MSIQMMTSDEFIVLSDWQQELITGGNAPQINNNNFAQRTGNVTGTNSSGPLGNTSETNTQMAEVNSGAQSILSSDTLGFSPLVRGLGNVPPNSLLPVGGAMGMF